jgi:ribonuclease HI
MNPKRRKRVTVYTDGACLGNPGPGGWAAILLWGPYRKEICGGKAHTTNNRMELQAAIEALRALREPAEVDLYTDSAYLKKGVTEWLPKWKEQGWRRKEGKTLRALANADLWQELDELLGVHEVRFHWIAGHTGHRENTRANELAREAMRAAAKGASSCEPGSG